MMDRLDELIKRFKEISSYSPKKGTINEAYGDIDTTGFVCIGEINYDPWLKGIDKLYIMVDPQKTMYGGKMQHKITYTENPDGTGSQTTSVPTYATREATIYPEHQDDELGELFLGKKKSDEQIKQEHQEFLSRLFIVDGNVIIHHNSSYEIKDGVIKKGKPNGWSTNNDVGIYFWGSRNNGNDPSNVSTYTYYSKIYLKELYDFETNAERLTLKKALKKYNYAGQYWKKGDAVVVSTLQPTPIWCIVDKSNGKWYDENWNEIEKPF